MPTWPLLLAFLAASLVLAVTPGPAVLYIVTRSVTQGRRAGLASAAGVALGNLGNAIGASVGLAALFAFLACPGIVAIPWLARTHGEAWTRYVAQVPRWLW